MNFASKTGFTMGLAVAALGFGVGCGDDSGTGGAGGSVSGSCAPGEGCPDVASECLALVDNTGKDKFAMRLSFLQVQKPAALKTPLVETLLDKGITLNLSSCLTQNGDVRFGGDGTFSLIMEFDTATDMLRVGGAYPVTDPLGGYCFVEETIQGFDVKPLEVSAPIVDGKFSIATAQDVTLPIYADASASDVILLPLRQVKITNAPISADNNCVGKYNGDTLDPNNLCLADETTPVFEPAASLDGFITLEDADKVAIPQLSGKTLCTLLAADDTKYLGDDGKTCKRDGAVITFKGDWCSTTNAAATATCFDAVSMEAKFSASGAAVKASCP